MKKKVVSLIMSVALAFSSMHVMNIAAENVKAESNLTEATVTNLNGYEFIDITSNGTTLVALTKNTARALGRLFYSTDNGVTWQPCQNQPLNSAATISSNKNSQQQLVYWKANNIFVAHGAASTYTSEDGIVWVENKNLHWTTNTMIDVSGDQLVFGGQDSANATADLTAKQFANNKYTIPNSSGFFAMVAVAKPAAEDGNISMFVCNQYKSYDLSFKTTSPKYTWTMQNNNQGSITTNAPYDATYSQEAGQYLIVDGSEKLYAIKDSKNIAKITVANGEKVVGVGTNEDYILVGTENGKLYKTNNTVLTTETAWDEIPTSYDDGTAEPLKNIKFIDKNNFVALGTTKAYTGEVVKSIVEPTEAPTEEPTAIPTIEPTATPTAKPTDEPKVTPTVNPTAKPEVTPTVNPTDKPEVTPTVNPTDKPEVTPTTVPTATPTIEPTEEPKDELLPEGYSFVDIASNGNNLVAMAKDEGRTVAQLCYSKDGGKTWKASENQPLAEKATISSNKNSQQQLVYWKANNIFVAHGAASTYTSTDGVTWTENTALHWTTNTMLTTSGNQLAFGGQDSANATADLQTKQFANNKYVIPKSSGYYAQVAVAKPADSEGNVAMFICDRYKAYDLSFQATSPKYTWTLKNNNAGTMTENAPYDALYAEKADQYFMVDGSEKLYAVTDSKNIAKITVADGEKIVGVGASDKYIVVGTESGKLYKTDNVAVTAETKWEEISIAAEDKISEPLRNIEFTDEDTFVALGNTKWYNGKAVNSTPTDNPIKPTVLPTTAPTENPVKPTTAPTENPVKPTAAPTENPIKPTVAPTDDPTKPTATPTTAPTEEPTPDPSGYSIRYENGKAVVNAPSGKYAVIFAAYDSDGKLISVAVKQDAEITKANQSVYPNKFTTAGAATGKVMLWDNLNNMVPRAAASIPFN